MICERLWYQRRGSPTTTPFSRVQKYRTLFNINIASVFGFLVHWVPRHWKSTKVCLAFHTYFCVLTVSFTIASSTKALLSGKLPQELHDSMAGNRKRREIVEQEKQRACPSGTGLTGALILSYLFALPHCALSRSLCWAWSAAGSTYCRAIHSLCQQELCWSHCHNHHQLISGFIHTCSIVDYGWYNVQNCARGI